jgi:hypothetical protein
MTNWLKRLFGGSDSSTSDAPEPATTPAPEPASMPAEPAAQPETTGDSSSGAGDEPA